MPIARSLVRGGLFVAVVASTFGAERLARANGLEIPENGTEVMGRAGAWTAKADNPLAAALNPAGLAGQKTGIILNANITYQSMCFQKQGNYPSGADNFGTKWQDPVYEGRPYPEVCKKNGFGALNVVPQLGFTYAINSKLAIGVLPLWTPSGTGKAVWPTEVDVGNTTGPSPNRFLLVEKNARIIMPTFSVGYEVAKGVRVGAGFQWVITMFQSKLMSQGTQSADVHTKQGPGINTMSEIKFNQFFTPAAVFGLLVTPHDDFDVGAMFRYSADIVYKGKKCEEAGAAQTSKPDCDVVITAPYYGIGTNSRNTPSYTGAQVKEFRLPQPMDLRLGFRWHPARKGAVLPKDGRRDSMAHDAFDVELDLTYSRNSSFNQLTILFDPGQNVYFAGANGGFIPDDASISKKWKDTIGVRLGGDYHLLPEKLSLRAGGFFQTKGQDEKYLNLDFHPGQMVGLYLGATLRATKGLDVSVGYGHIWVKPFDNTKDGGGQVRGLIATQPDSATGPNYYSECSSPTATAEGYSQPPQPYRSCAITNSGKLTSAYNMFSVGATYRF
ncbi:MAG: outer membrane protein transport protein [Deltaproteobacteria bacterium]|nr:outer membrane protein transport protein [Deltaproteobacteria bacterium]